MINVREKWPSNRQRSMVIFRKDHVLEAGVNGIVQVKNLPIFFFLILKNFMVLKVNFIRSLSMILNHRTQ